MGKKDILIAKKVLGEIANKRGLMWDKISHFKQELNKIEGVLTHKAGEEQSAGLKKAAPLKHNFEGGIDVKEDLTIEIDVKHKGKK